MKTVSNVLVGFVGKIQKGVTVARTYQIDKDMMFVNDYGVPSQAKEFVWNISLNRCNTLLARPRVLLLNGPPESGKDTIGNLLQEQLDCALTCFKFNLYKVTAKYFEEDLDWFINVATDRRYKDKFHFKELGGRTPREALVYVSEEVCKPKFGDDYFGKLARDRVATHPSPDLVVFTDSGFESEVPPLLEVADVVIIQLHGRGSFVGDSRDYVNIEGVRTLVINLIEGNPQAAVDSICSKLGL